MFGNRLTLHTRRRQPAARLTGIAMTCAAVLTISPAVTRGVDEVHVYGVAKNGGTHECLTAAKSHDMHTLTATAFSAWFSGLVGLGEWDDVRANNDSDCWGRLWTDASKSASCGCVASDSADRFGVDDADVLFIHTHGGHSATASTLTMGNDYDTCAASTSTHMKFNDDLQIAVIKACESGNYEVWYDDPANSTDNTTYRTQFTTSSSQFSVWNAFHGTSSCGTHVVWYVTTYAMESSYNGVGENWIDEAYDDNRANEDDCPVSIVFGSSSSNRNLMFEYGGWLDRKDTGSKTASSYFRISGCDPAAGIVLP